MCRVGHARGTWGCAMFRGVWLLLLPLVATAPSPASPGHRAVPTPAPAAAVLAGNAQVRFELQYPSCGIRREGQGPLPRGLVGLARRQVASVFGSDVIVRFEPNLLVLRRRLPGCPQDSVTLVARSGQVMVLQGPRGDAQGPGRPTGIRLRGLPPALAQQVEAGWTVPAAALAETLARLRTA